MVSKNERITSPIIKSTALPSFLKRQSREKRVLVGGCFDILHFGHIMFLNQARKEGARLYVALEPDEFIRVHKKREPVHTQMERASILSSLRMVDVVILLPVYRSYDDYLNLVKNIEPGVIAVTENDSQIENKRKQASVVGASLKIVTPHISPFSSSSIHTYASFFGDRFAD